MDQLKVFMAVMKKQHFWVITCLVLVLGLTGWAMATSTLYQDFVRDKGKIESTFKDLEALRNKEPENQSWIDGLKQESERLKAKVKGAWEDVYAEQRDKVLRWPDVLGEDFLRTVPQLGPVEDIPIDQRERYWNYAREEFPRLLTIVDARSYLDKTEPIVKTRGMAGGRLGPPGKEKAGAEAEPPQHDYIVRWDKKDQQAIHERLDWNAVPTTQEVRQTQEDLWVYQSLLTIIKHLNDRADGHHNAKVKEIRGLLIGHDAASRFQEVMAEDRLDHPNAPAVKSGAGAGPGMGMGGPGGMKPRMPGPAGMGGAMPGGISGPGGRVALDEGRYVDEKGMPLATGMSSATGMPPATGAAAPPEFKRMPIVMQLLMDQREISRFLVESANSPLPIEVRQMRIKAVESEDGVLDMRAGAVRGGAAKIGAGRAGGKMAIDEGLDDERDKSPYDVLVEMQGIIYIFSPPDQVKLAPATASEPGAAADESTDVGATGNSEATQASEPEQARETAQPKEPAAPEPPADSSDDDEATDEQPADEPAPSRKPARPAAKQPAETPKASAKPDKTESDDPDATEAMPEEER